MEVNIRNKVVSNLDVASRPGQIVGNKRAAQTLAISTLLILTASSFMVAIAVPTPAGAATTSSSSTGTVKSLVDDFTKDAALDTSLWQINGPVGSAFGLEEIGTCISFSSSGTALLPLEPTFSSDGMEIAGINANCRGFTIQSVQAFVPPFSATAVVEGTVANGFGTFVFAISSASTDTGLVINGDLNPQDCSSLGDCGDPSTCGNPANENVATGNCFYGIGVKTGAGGGTWARLDKLYLTPSVDVFYTVQISVDVSGTAQYSISAGGNRLGEASTTVGTGPFYIILAEAEGTPVQGPGPNVAYWQSVSVNPSAASFSVYPTEPSYTTVTLNYTGQSLSGPIHVAVENSKGLPLGLNVTLRADGTKDFTKTLDLQPSSSGSSRITLNATLDCLTGKCNQPGGTQLPMDYNLTITASSGSYSKTSALQVQLQQAKWLVMLYSAADTGAGPGKPNDIEKSMASNLVQMAKASSADDNPAVGVLVLFAAGWAYTFPSNCTAPGTTQQPSDTIRLYRIANGTISQVGANWPETAANNPNTLNKFLSTSMALIPADRNQLIISGHGAGIQGVASDFLNGDTYMSIPQLADALAGVSPKLDILSFDACLMGQVDVLYQLRNDATYFTASERTVPGTGYDYTHMLLSLFDDPDQPTVDYLKNTVMYYGIKFSSQGLGRASTLAAINASELGGVVSALNSLSGILLQDYKANSGEFNASMLQVILHSQYANGEPYVDVRSFAQNILLSPSITDQNLKNAATAVIQATEEAVIANYTNYFVNGVNTPKMYEGLTVLLFGGARIPRLTYQMFAGFDNKLSFSNAAHWLPLLQAVNRSASASEAAWTLILLVHPGHQLFLSAYNSASGQTGINPGLLNDSRAEMELINGSYYCDLGNGTTLIALPSTVQSFSTVVDGSSMSEATEPYTMTYTVIQNGTVTSTRTVQGTIARDTLQSANATIQDGAISVAAATISSLTQSTTTLSSIQGTASSSLSASHTSSASSAASSTSYTTNGLMGMMAAVAVIGTISLVALRRRP